MGEQKQSHLQGTLQDSGYWEEGEKFRERGFPGRRREGGVSMHTSAQHLKSLCSAVESLTEACMGSDLGRKEIPPAALGRAGGG